MVDVVRLADPVGKVDHIGHGGHHIVGDDVAGDQVIVMAAQKVLLRLLPLQGLHLGQQGQQGGDVDVLVEAGLDRREGQEARGGGEVVAHHLHGLVLDLHGHGVDAGVLDLLGLLLGDVGALLQQHLAGDGGNHHLGGDLVHDAGLQAQLLIELIPAHPGKVVPVVEEQAVEQAPGALLRGGLAGALALVDLDEAVSHGTGGVLLQGVLQPLVLAQQLLDLGVGAVADGAQERGDEHLALPVDLDVQDAVRIGLVLQPGAPIGDDLGGIELVAPLVGAHRVVGAGGTDQLADDDPLGAVDDEGALGRHEREIAHEHFLLLHFAGLLVDEPDRDPQGCGVVHVVFLALLLGVLGLIEIDPIVHELQHELAGIVDDGGDVIENLAKVLFQKAVVGILLHLNEIGHAEHFVDLGKALADPPSHLSFGHGRNYGHTPTV